MRLPNGITELDQGSFINSNLRSVILPSSLISILGKAFYGCTHLTSIRIPNSVKFFEGSRIFNECKSLKDVVLSENIRHIPLGCFSYTSISNIVILKSVRSIGPFAFGSSLKSITIPKTIYITKSAFPYGFIKNNVIKFL